METQIFSSYKNLDRLLRDKYPCQKKIFVWGDFNDLPLYQILLDSASKEEGVVIVGIYSDKSYLEVVEKTFKEKSELILKENKKILILEVQGKEEIPTIISKIRPNVIIIPESNPEEYYSLEVAKSLFSGYVDDIKVLKEEFQKI